MKAKAVVEAMEKVVLHLDSKSEVYALSPSNLLTNEEILPFRSEMLRLLEKILTHRFCYEGLYLLLETNILDYILPEVKAMVGVSQPPEFHPEGDVFEHTALTLFFLEERRFDIAMAALLHDVGKPLTYRVEERIRFDGHNVAALPLIRRISERFCLDERTRELSLFVAKEHMRLLDAREMRPGRLRNLLMHPLFEGLLRVWYADILASYGDLGDYWFVKEKFDEYKASRVTEPLLVSGDDLISAGYSPGPVFKKILEAVREAQSRREIRNREDALEFIRQRFGNLK
ncbi:MAG: HD domain-containing protein [Planctomycetota bacterium]|nr:HD domain-containing protein [Planctomycetota bacterium]